MLFWVAVIAVVVVVGLVVTGTIIGVVAFIQEDQTTRRHFPRA